MGYDLILASGSRSRQEMLGNAGYSFDIIPADIDEEFIIKNSSEKIENISLKLAQQKAKFISQKKTENYIIGSDQVLIMNDKIYSKAKNYSEAVDRLKNFQGKTHFLHSAVSVYKNGEEMFSSHDTAELKMRTLNNTAIDDYCNKAGDVLTSCVGCYALESIGLRLFEEIKGDYFTILGMPLLPLCNFLDNQGFKL